MSFYSKPKKRADLTKREAEKIHAKRRAMERYGIEVSLVDIVRMIRTGKSHFVRRQSNRVAVHEVVYKEKKMRVVYDHKRKTVVTFLLPKTEENTVFSQESSPVAA